MSSNPKLPNAKHKEFLFKATSLPSLTKVIPVLLHVLDLQLVAAFSEDGFGVLLEASRQNASLPWPCIYPAVHVNDHCRQTKDALY